MEDSISIRALTIGISIFIALATMTVVLSYYSSAKEQVSKIGAGVNIDEAYKRQLANILDKASANYTLNGTDVKNLINFYYKNLDASINIKKMKIVDNSGNVVEESINSIIYDSVNQTTAKYNNVMKKLISAQKFRLEKFQDGYTIILNIEGE